LFSVAQATLQRIAKRSEFNKEGSAGFFKVASHH
jgi:hypothetical protein